MERTRGVHSSCCRRGTKRTREETGVWTAPRHETGAPGRLKPVLGGVMMIFRPLAAQIGRATITKLQPEISEFVASLAASNPDQADELAPMIEWSNSCHKSEKLEQTMPLARLVSCASAQFKRSREEASQHEAKKDHVAAMAKKQDELVSSLDAKVARIGELEALCNERQASAEKLQAELARIGGLKQAFDFNNASSREAVAPAALTSCAAEAKSSIAPNMVASTSVASAAAVEDELLSFVNAASSGYAGNRICQSATGHAYLGVSGSSDGDVAAAIRMGSI